MASPDPILPEVEAAGASPSLGRQALYLFAFSGDAPALAAGWEASALFARPSLYPVGPIAALITTVPLDEYCGPTAANHLSEVGWLSPRIVYHAAVLRRAMQYAPIYPAPFGTLYSSYDSLTRFMLAHQETIEEFFRAVAGQEEWELKATAAIGSLAALEAQARRTWPDWEGLTPGTRYLRLRQDRPVLIEAARKAAERTVFALAEQLLPPALSIRRLPRQPHAPNEASAELVARFALLVPADAAAALGQSARDLAARAADREVTLSLSGPWPPFSFRPDLPHVEGQTGA